MGGFIHSVYSLTKSRLSLVNIDELSSMHASYRASCACIFVACLEAVGRPGMLIGK